MEKLKKVFTIDPSQSSGWELAWKFFIWLVMWGVISALLFMILSFVGSVFTESMWQTWEFVKSNPILPLLLLLIWFLSSFIGNLAIAWIYWLFFNQRYYKIWKTIWLLLLTNGILFMVLAPVYIIFNSDINILFVILGFHIMFSIFLSSNQIEVICNPNYSASSIVGTTLGFIVTILIYSLIRKNFTMWSTQEKLYLLLLMPSIIWFSIMPLWLWIREKIYYKMYEIWNNGFYAPSIEEKDNIKEDFISPIDEDSDINIDLN
jgi:hypothetical protein